MKHIQKNIKIGAFAIIMLVSNQAIAQINKVEIRATGLTCAMCSNAIYKQLETITFVDSIHTDLNTNTFTLFLNNQNKLSPKDFKDKVEKAGFFVGSMILHYASTFSVNANYIIIAQKTNAINNTYKVLDKGYVTAKEYKKLAKKYKKIITYTANKETDFHLSEL